jgi:hypothetical protein
LDRSGLDDEVSAFFAALAGGFLGNIKRFPTLCADFSEEKKLRRKEISQNVLTGFFGGSSVVALTPAPLVSFVDLSILLGFILIVPFVGLQSERIIKKKICPHSDCMKKGNCSQRVCRHCFRLFWPEDIAVDPSKIVALDWLSVASFLHMQGLSYLDSEKLVRENFYQWKLLPQKDDGNNESVKIACNNFQSWVFSNNAKLLSYKSSGLQDKSKEDAIKYLDQRDL